jgi:peptidoglycan/LPS O-acetylase OafA/YrhL
MFGAYRAFLALMVVLSHLGGMPGGGYPVIGFYILSGYLMTLILQTTYGYSLKGLRTYGANRFLRIYPCYWAACLLAAALVWWCGSAAAKEYHPMIFLPDDTVSLLRHLFIVFEHGRGPRLVPPVWALTVEVSFYILIGLGLSRNRKMTLVWFTASAAYAIMLIVQGADFDHRYYPIPAVSFAFATGAMIFHFYPILQRRAGWLTRDFAPAILFGLLLLNQVISIWTNTLLTRGFYVNYLLSAAMVVALASKTALPYLSKPVDRALGDLSYPIYLLHYQAGMILIGLGLTRFHRFDPVFALAALPILFVLAWLLDKGVEEPMEKIRRKLKGA